MACTNPECPAFGKKEITIHCPDNNDAVELKFVDKTLEFGDTINNPQQYLADEAQQIACALINNLSVGSLTKLTEYLNRFMINTARDTFLKIIDEKKKSVDHKYH